jgi:hypothetical protein
MKKLGCFVLGILSYMCFIPLLESSTEFLCGKFEILKGENTKKMLKINKEISDLQASLEPVNTQCIGFQMTGDDEEYDDEGDWEEDKLKNKIGFL